MCAKVRKNRDFKTNSHCTNREMGVCLAMYLFGDGFFMGFFMGSSFFFYLYFYSTHFISVCVCVQRCGKNSDVKTNSHCTNREMDVCLAMFFSLA